MAEEAGEGGRHKWRFPNIGVPFLGVPIIIRIIAYLGILWVPLFLGNAQIELRALLSTLAYEWASVRAGFEWAGD